MSNKCCKPHPLISHPGTAQKERLPQALDPKNVHIDGRDLLDFLDMVLKLSRQIQFYNEDLEVRDWQPFFMDSPPFILASISKFDINALEDGYKALSGILKNQMERETLAPLFDYVYTETIKPLNDWYLKFNSSHLGFGNLVSQLITGNLQSAIKEYILLTNTANNLFGIKKRSYFDLQKNAPWQLNLSDLFISQSNFGDERQNARMMMLQLSEQLENLFNQFTAVIKELSFQAVGFIEESILPLEREYQEKHQPHLGLFFAFLKLYKTFQTDLNKLSAKHLEFFYKKVLRINPRVATPDQATLIFEIQKNLEGGSYLLSKETLLDAGKDLDNNDLLFELNEEILIDSTQVEQLKTIHLKQNIFPNLAQNRFDYLIEGLYLTSDATKADGIGEEFPEGSIPSWPTLGDKFSKHFDPTKEEISVPINYPVAKQGFILASSVLLLNEGQREVTIKLNCLLEGAQKEEEKTIINNLFGIADLWVEESRIEIDKNIVEVVFAEGRKATMKGAYNTLIGNLTDEIKLKIELKNPNPGTPEEQDAKAKEINDLLEELANVINHHKNFKQLFPDFDFKLNTDGTEIIRLNNEGFWFQFQTVFEKLYNGENKTYQAEESHFRSLLLRALQRMFNIGLIKSYLNLEPIESIPDKIIESILNASTQDDPQNPINLNGQKYRDILLEELNADITTDPDIITQSIIDAIKPDHNLDSYNSLLEELIVLGRRLFVINKLIENFIDTFFLSIITSRVTYKKLNNDFQVNEPLAPIFNLNFSGEEDWVRPLKDQVHTYFSWNNTDASLEIQIKVNFTAEEPAITFYNPEVLGTPLNTALPLVQLMLNPACKIPFQPDLTGFDSNNHSCLMNCPSDTPISVSFYQFFRHLVVAESCIEVNVSGVKQLVVQNDENVQDINELIYPFGVRPTIQDDKDFTVGGDAELRGSNFYVGSKEVLCKRWDKIWLNLSWKDKPADLEDHYEGYEDISAGIGTIKDEDFKLKISVLEEQAWKKERKVISNPYTESTPESPILHKKYRHLFDSSLSLLPPAPDEKIVYDQRLQLEREYFDLPDRGKTMDQESLEKLEVNTRNGFLRLTLKNRDFQHDRYSFVLARQMLAYGKFPDDYVFGAVYGVTTEEGETERVTTEEGFNKKVSRPKFDIQQFSLFSNVVSSFLVKVKEAVEAVVDELEKQYNEADPNSPTNVFKNVLTTKLASVFTQEIDDVTIKTEAVNFVQNIATDIKGTIDSNQVIETIENRIKEIFTSQALAGKVSVVIEEIINLAESGFGQQDLKIRARSKLGTFLTNIKSQEAVTAAANIVTDLSDKEFSITITTPQRNQIINHINTNNNAGVTADAIIAATPLTASDRSALIGIINTNNNAGNTADAIITYIQNQKYKFNFTTHQNEIKIRIDHIIDAYITNLSSLDAPTQEIIDSIQSFMLVNPSSQFNRQNLRNKINALFANNFIDPLISNKVIDQNTGIISEIKRALDTPLSPDADNGAVANKFFLAVKDLLEHGFTAEKVGDEVQKAINETLGPPQNLLIISEEFKEKILGAVEINNLPGTDPRKSFFDKVAALGTLEDQNIEISKGGLDDFSKFVYDLYNQEGADGKTRLDDALKDQSVKNLVNGMKYFVDNAKVEKSYVIIPKEPYTPIISNLAIDYTAYADKDEIELIHIYPFENTFKKEEWEKDGNKASILPVFEEEGTLYIGLKDFNPGRNLNLLFHLAEATADTEMDKAELKWHYLSNNEWLELNPGFHILDDQTRELSRSGIIKFNIPTDISSGAGTTLLSPDLHWLKVSALKNSKTISETINVYTQAAQATYKAKTEDNRESMQLPSETITSTAIADSNIKKVSQVYDSFGGVAEEASNRFYTRVSESLRHKGRALTLFDYERLVLDQFPLVNVAKCINHNFGLSASQYKKDLTHAAGFVTLAVIPDLNQIKVGSLLEPRVPLSVLEDIQAFLKKRSSPFVRIRVMNPRYEKVKVRITVVLNKENDSNASYYQDQLVKDIRVFLSPWLNRNFDSLRFGQSLSKSDLIQFVENLSYVDYIQALDFHLDTKYDENCKPINEAKRTQKELLYPTSARSILTAGNVEATIQKRGQRVIETAP